MMPDMDGWEVYQQMKADEATRHIPVIVVTAKAQSIDKVLGLHIAKVDDYIAKPFSPQELLTSVENTLARRAKRTRIRSCEGCQPLRIFCSGTGNIAHKLSHKLRLTSCYQVTATSVIICRACFPRFAMASFIFVRNLAHPIQDPPRIQWCDSFFGRLRGLMFRSNLASWMKACCSACHAIPAWILPYTCCSFHSTWLCSGSIRICTSWISLSPGPGGPLTSRRDAARYTLEIHPDRLR